MGTTAGAPIDVLVIEDDRDVQRCIVAGLETHGFRVAVTANGAAAVEWLTSHPAPRMIMLDWFMPVMTGEEFLEVQRANPSWSRIPVVVLSASPKRPSASPSVTRQLKFLRKPISLRELVDVVNAHVGS
jgi:CheY-like chemotaxis protein